MEQHPPGCSTDRRRDLCEETNHARPTPLSFGSSLFSSFSLPSRSTVPNPSNRHLGSFVIPPLAFSISWRPFNIHKHTHTHLPAPPPVPNRITHPLLFRFFLQIFFLFSLVRLFHLSVKRSLVVSTTECNVELLFFFIIWREENGAEDDHTTDKLKRHRHRKHVRGVCGLIITNSFLFISRFHFSFVRLSHSGVKEVSTYFVIDMENTFFSDVTKSTIFPSVGRARETAITCHFRLQQRYLLNLRIRKRRTKSGNECKYWQPWTKLILQRCLTAVRPVDIRI